MIRLALQVILLGVMAAALVILGAQSLHLIEAPIVVAPQPVRWSPEMRNQGPIAPIERPPITTFSQTTARPLFFEGRRFPTMEPAPAKAPAQAAPSPPPPPKAIVSADKFKLLGIALFGTEKRALIEGPSVLQDWYTEGAKLQDWTLTRIENNAIILTYEGQTARRELYRSAEPN